MTAWDFRSRGFMAVAVASVASSVLAFVIFVILGLRDTTSSNRWFQDPTEIAVILAVVLIWAPAAAAIPAGILGLLVERPKAKAAMKRGQGGIVPYVLLSVVAGGLLSFLPTFVRHLMHPEARLFDPLTLALFTLIGFCSGISWWFLVVGPGRRG